MDDYGLSNPEPSALAELIADAAMIDRDSAASLAWGEAVSLDSAELDRLSDAFSLHRDLLSCLLRPASSEMIVHVLHQTSEMELEESDCPLCHELAILVQQTSTKDNRTTLLELCIDLLSHLTIDNFTSELDLTSTPSPISAQLDLVLNSLPMEAQLRVLAYAYQELAETSDGQRAASFTAYAKLRNDHLSSLARQVLDLLAVSDNYSLSAREIVHSLGLANARALGQLPRSLARSLSQINVNGEIIHDSPLTVSGSKGSAVFTLSEEARSYWRALVQADNAETRSIS